MPMYDALIIGAGPAGNFCAYKLAKQGMRVLLLESQKKIKRKVCGEYLSPMGVDILKDENLDELLIKPFLPIKGMKINPANEEALNTFFPGKEGIALNRKIFDTNFAGIAKDAGATVELGARVNKIEKESLCWGITFDQDGETKKVKTRLLIGADGRNSFTAKALGLKTVTDTERLALHCHINSPQITERMGEMHLFQDGSYIGVDPTGDHEVNISLCCKSSLIKNKTPRELLNEYISSSTNLSNRYGLIPEDIKVNTVTPITNKMDKFISSNAALIGDAAGFLDPLTGEGMFNGLWMAKTLCEEIAVNTKISIFDYQDAIDKYAIKKTKYFKQKKLLNIVFQFIIKKPRIISLLSHFLKKKQERANIFVGIIGNIYKPIEGILKILNS